MEALNRKPDLTARRSMNLPDGTMIEVVGVNARTMAVVANNKALSDFDRGIHLTAAKIHVNGKPIVPDDLLDNFTDEELNQIIEFVNPDEEKEGTSEKNG